jgi:hypothetical protein
MRLLYIDIPNAGNEIFNKNFVNKVVELDNLFVPIHSTGTSWNYPAQIKGWRDWDFTSQSEGKFRDVDEFGYASVDILATTVRNPFNLLYQYFINDWAWCRKYHNLPTDNHTIADFHKFVDIYLDRSIVFHAPLFRNSLFSQLKDINGNWLLTDTSIILRYESIEADINKFRKHVNLTDINLESLPKQIDYFNMYTKAQVKLLKVLWKDDLDYLGYTFGKTIQSKPISTPPPKEPKNTKKIAICFSGEIRDLERTKDYWSKLIKEYDMDVYASFWNVENEENGDTFDNFHRLYDVKKTEVESFKSFEQSTLSQLRMGINPPNSLQQHLRDSCMNFGTLSMWYKIWRANLLTKELDIDYDIVIRARTDIFFDERLDITENEMFNIPYGRVKTSDWKDSDGICDLFAYGSPKLMDYYSTCLFYMMEHLNKDYYMVPHEFFLHTHINKVSVPIRFLGTNLTITRTSKGSDDELYCKGVDVKEEILQSDFMELTPNSELRWRGDIKNILK